MHIVKEVGAKSSNPHPCTTNIMLDSIYVEMRFKSAKAAYKCCKLASEYGRYECVGVCSGLTSFPHRVYLRPKGGITYVTQSDLHRFADYANESTYDFHIFSYGFLPNSILQSLMWRSWIKS